MEPTPEMKGRPMFIDIVGKFDPARDEPRVWLNRYLYYGQYLKLKDIDLALTTSLYSITNSPQCSLRL
jgi:hypothetical protein